MITINNITIPLESISNGGPILLISIREIYEFLDNKRTLNIIAIGYTVVCPSNKFCKTEIKIPGKTPAISTAKIEESGGTLEVDVKNFQGKFYNSREKGILFTAKASEITLVN